MDQPAQARQQPVLELSQIQEDAHNAEATLSNAMPAARSSCLGGKSKGRRKNPVESAAVVGNAARTSCRMQEPERERRHRCAAGRAGSSGVENTMMKRVVERVGFR
jgi:hypothetical protein